MDIHFSSLPLEDLKHLHRKADMDLQQALLNGDQWESIRIKKQVVTQLAVLVHKRMEVHKTESPTPADTQMRDDSPVS